MNNQLICVDSKQVIFQDHFSLKNTFKGEAYL